MYSGTSAGGGLGFCALWWVRSSPACRQGSWLVVLSQVNGQASDLVGGGEPPFSCPHFWVFPFCVCYPSSGCTAKCFPSFLSLFLNSRASL